MSRRLRTDNLIVRGILVRTEQERRGLPLLEAAQRAGVSALEFKAVQDGRAPERIVQQVEVALGLGG